MLIGGNQEIVYWGWAFQQDNTILAHDAVSNCAICRYVIRVSQNNNDKIDCSAVETRYIASPTMQVWTSQNNPRPSSWFDKFDFPAVERRCIASPPMQAPTLKRNSGFDSST